MIIILRLIILVAALIAGAPGGDWGATRLPLPGRGAFNLPTWLTAIAGAAVLLPACYLVTGRAGGRMAAR
jgi:hypothetical protein